MVTAPVYQLPYQPTVEDPTWTTLIFLHSDPVLGMQIRLQFKMYGEWKINNQIHSQVRLDMDLEKLSRLPVTRPYRTPALPLGLRQTLLA